VSLGLHIKTLREKKDFSQRQLAYLSGVSNTEINRIESGDRKKPSPDILRSLAAPLGVSYKDLMAAAGYLDGIDLNLADSPTPPIPDPDDELDFKLAAFNDGEYGKEVPKGLEALIRRIVKEERALVRKKK